MITPQLERWLLNGTASFAVHTHALSMFGRIPCSPGKLAIITKIVWYPFINPVRPSNLATMTWMEFFRYCEYALKIEGKTTTVVYNFRNQLQTVLWNSTFALDGVISIAQLNRTQLQPGPPQIIDAFIPCTEFIKLTISRNAMLDSYPSNSFGPLSQRANEPAAPNGPGSANLLRQLQMQAIAGGNFYYNPPSSQYSGVAAGGARDVQNYVHDFQDQTAATYGSTLSAPDTAGTAWPSNMPGTTHPLINFHVVYVNKEDADKLQPS